MSTSGRWRWTRTVRVTRSRGNRLGKDWNGTVAAGMLERAEMRGSPMTYSLIDDDANGLGGTVPLTPLGKDGLVAWRERATERERDWVQALDFKAEAGKTALLPD